MRRLLLGAPILFATVLSAQAPKLAKLTEDLRLDATAEDFPSVGAVVVGPRGQLLVGISRDNQLRVYDAAGKKLGVIGRTGSGPGEFRSLAGIGYVADTLWVFDFSLRRISFFGPDLKLLHTDPIPQAKVPGAVQSADQWQNARFFPSILKADGSSIGTASYPTSARSTDPWTRVLAVQSRSGDVTPLPMSPDYRDPKVFMFFGGLENEVPFMLMPQVATMADGSRFGVMSVDNNRPDGGDILVNTFSLAKWATGRNSEERVSVELSKKISFKGEPIPASVRDSALASFIPQRGRPTEGPSEGPQRFQAMARDRMPSFYNPVSSMLLGLDKTVWLLRPTRNDQWSADVYDGRGTLLGRVEPPKKTRIRHGTATHVWTTQRDEDDLISIVRYRITWQ